MLSDNSARTEDVASLISGYIAVYLSFHLDLPGNRNLQGLLTALD